MIKISRIPQELQFALRAHCNGRAEAMRGYRLSWWSHWALLAEMFLPRRYRWFVAPNQYQRGSPMNQAIVDETGLLAARTLATGLLADLTSPTKPWFRLGLAGMDEVQSGPVADWLYDATNVILRILAESNFYQAMGVAFHDLVVFGSAAIIQYEDPDSVVRFYNPALGEFGFGISNRLDVNVLWREYTYTIAECVEEFGLENVSESTRVAFTGGGPNLELELVISHMIEPNTIVYQGGKAVGTVAPPDFKYREVYWERASSSTGKNMSDGTLLRVAGFKEKPFAGLRWDVTSNDAYGRSPGMDALPAVRQLQIEQRRKAEGIDKMVRPAMVASVSMKNEPMDITPGGVTFVADPAASGFKPAYTVEPRITELMEDLKEVQERVREVMFNKLFTGISDLDTVRTATEIDAVREEKLILIGPVIERVESEGLDETLERTFAIAARRKLLPPAPPEIQGHPLTIKYISIFAQAQRAASTAAIERIFGFAGNLVGVIPDIMDNLDADRAIEQYGEELNVDPDIMRAIKDVLAIRAARTQAQQQAAALQTGQTLAQAGQTMSQTPVGGGASMLNKVLGTAP